MEIVKSNKPFLMVYIVLFFIADIFSFSLIGVPLLHFLLCFYCFILFCSTRVGILVFTTFFLVLEQFLFYGISGFFFLYFIPLSLIGFHFRQLVDPTFMTYSMLVTTLFLQFGVANYLIYCQVWPFFYTFSLFIANMIIIAAISFIFLYNKQGNRF